MEPEVQMVLCLSLPREELKVKLLLPMMAGLDSKLSGRQLEVMNSLEFLRYQYERQWDAGYPDQVMHLSADMVRGILLTVIRMIPSINWQDRVLGGRAYYQNHNIAISGGTKTTNYRLSYSRDDEKGLLVGNGFNRNNFKLRLDQKVTDKLSFSSNAGYSFTNIKGGGTSERRHTWQRGYVQAHHRVRRSCKCT